MFDFCTYSYLVILWHNGLYIKIAFANRFKANQKNKIKSAAI